ncbi:MAG: methyltransferase domain-containing protein, partial [Syntrophorhabdus sp.]
MSQFRSLVEKHFPNRTIEVLDVGSYGVNGTYREIFSDRTLFSYTGLDLEPGPNVDYVADDPYSWNGIKDGSFDVIISGQAFEHIEFPWLVMEEISRALKADGMACIVAPSRGPEHKYPVDCWRYYPDGFVALAKWAGLEVLDSKTCWGKSGFTDGSDQWGDTFCILYKRDDASGQKRHGRPARLSAGTPNASSPLVANKDQSYYDFERSDVIDFISENGIKPKRVLEIGCARGSTGKKLRQIFDIEYYAGIELSPDAANIARNHLDTVIIADVEKEDLTLHGIKYADFDMVIALDVLEHLYDPWNVAAQLKRYLKPGGYVVASIPNIQNITILKSLSRGTWQYCDSGILDATHIRFFTQDSIAALFTGTGMSLKQFKCVFNPAIDINTIKESNNRVADQNFVLSGLSKSDVIQLFTYQYLVIAQNDNVPFRVESDLSFSLKRKEIVKGLVSIIILTFNQLDYTKRCFESIRDNTPEKHEIIFVDNNSSDGT